MPYNKLSDKNLICLHNFFLTHIHQGTLSAIMFNEVKLLEAIARKRGILLFSFWYRPRHK
ncbi:hypothetical protein [Halobacillus salinus]|uniref:hypothetical protein n=1 Tax=Halobacillus salinus TaxID=192814 RepID=UPI0009A87E7B|nr:hypothetical protein [Halobacillus salinus]